MTVRFLVATVQGHGLRDSDFMWATEGEPVNFIPAADGERHEDPDHPRCACTRAFIGVYSSKTTTTVRVADVDMTRKALIDAVFAAQSLSTRAEIAEYVDDLRSVIAHWPVGTVVERRGADTIRERLTPEEAAAWCAEHEMAALGKIERELAEAQARTAELRAKYLPLLTGDGKDGEGR